MVGAGYRRALVDPKRKFAALLPQPLAVEWLSHPEPSSLVRLTTIHPETRNSKVCSTIRSVRPTRSAFGRPSGPPAPPWL